MTIWATVHIGQKNNPYTKKVTLFGVQDTQVQYATPTIYIAYLNVFFVHISGTLGSGGHQCTNGGGGAIFKKNVRFLKRIPPQ